MMKALKAGLRRLHFNPESHFRLLSRILSATGDALQETFIWHLGTEWTGEWKNGKLITSW